ncbi:MAG: aminopeptidase, partial [Burkholderiales bacterium]
AYYWQSVNGQLEIWRNQQAIETVIAQPQTPEGLKHQLQSVLVMREFASRELALPENGSYRKYADLDRPYVLWNVFAAPEFSIQPREWCFVIAGCVSYRGYFSESAAREFAATLRAQGYDVFSGGVPAYSTLGWFNDPVLNTFVHYPESELARLIFHELAHQLVYVTDDSMFNESFAAAVEQEGVRRWLDKNGNDAARAEFAAAQERKKGFIALVLRYRARLGELYATNASAQQKRADKTRIFNELKLEYAALKAEWGGFSGYDRWFAQDINNAHLASVAAYTRLVPAFQRLLAQEQGNLLAFYRRVKEIAQLPKAERSAHLGSPE